MILVQKSLQATFSKLDQHRGPSSIQYERVGRRTPGSELLDWHIRHAQHLEILGYLPNDICPHVIVDGKKQFSIKEQHFGYI